jgi:hypothetical protein
MKDLLPRFADPLLLLLTVLISSGSIQAQEMKYRELRPAFDFSKIQMPVEIVSIQQNGQEIKPGEKILGNDDWLRGVSFSLKNISDKPIAYVGMGIRFPLPRGFVVYMLSYGVDMSRGEPRSASSPLPIMPGERLDLVFDETNYKGFLHILEQAEAAKSFEIAPYYLHRVCFENEPEVFWEGGFLKRRDPGHLFKDDIVEKYVLPRKQK